MANFEIVMPKLGESIIEATITRWLKKPGDKVEEDESIVELATDKVDSEIPSPVSGTLTKTLFEEGDVVPVGKIIALIDIGGEQEESTVTGQKESTAEESPKVEKVTAESVEQPVEETPAASPKQPVEEAPAASPEQPVKETPAASLEQPVKNTPAASLEQPVKDTPAASPKQPVEEAPVASLEQPAKETPVPSPGKFYSPLVKNIAKEENIALSELESLPGSGKEGRLTKDDMVNYLASRKAPAKESAAPVPPEKVTKVEPPRVVAATGDRVVEMDRMRRLIADHMVMSKQVSPHVTSFIEADVTNIVRWREKFKEDFSKKTGQKITYTAFFVEAAAKALREFPNVNASVDGYNIIQRNHIHIGIATALPGGNLIVPVIRDADQKNLAGLAKDLNELAERARANKLSPDEIQGGTFTITNFGTFDSLTGTPIINQPQVAILGIGAIKKRPWVLETPDGDVIAIRSICMLSMSYDHRIVDGAMAGQFIKRLQQILEGFVTF